MKRKRNGGAKRREIAEARPAHSSLHPDTRKSVWAVAFIGAALVLVLAEFGVAGPLGAWIFKGLSALLGAGYPVLPFTLLYASGVLLFSEEPHIVGTTTAGAGLLLLSFLGLIEIFAPARGGILGLILGSLKIPFGKIAAGVIDLTLLAAAVIITANVPLKTFLPSLRRGERDEEPEAEDEAEIEISEPKPAPKKAEKEAPAAAEEKEDEIELEVKEAAPMKPAAKGKTKPPPIPENYVPPPLSLLQSGTEKPTTGDLRANANIIKRTLESFGISVEMGEINIGPKVTRYTLKPAEGMKLSRITALHQDLALALAAHPIRIEAPIPGKSLVGIEVPNKAAALVRLGSLMSYPEFQGSGPLAFALGRDVTGEPIFGNIEKMPHLLVAGATGSGKSVTIHSLIVSLLYKNAPSTLKLIMIDPKRVELSIYEGIPHLVSPVITENKKAIGVFRWALHEMDRRYDVLVKAGSRDIKSYNSKHKEEALPYLAIIVDELADLMATYGREVEGSIVRLAQMARATGIHLVLSTQRPSVEVITGLIKANITSRIALQVASQIDSRTILDASGAEKLLGGGDLLFVSAELSKPKRIQGCYLSESEITSVAQFIREHNDVAPQAEPAFAQNGGAEGGGAGPVRSPEGPQGEFASNGDMFSQFENDEDSDDLYDEAVQVVRESKKASASLLQRRLKVGYARAARLLDLMEARGVVGPGDGAKPREVYVEETGRSEDIPA